MKILELAEKKLWQRGFAPTIRKAILWIWVAALILFVAGVLLLPATSWFFWLGCAALLSAWNFFSLAFFIQKSLYPSMLDVGKSRFLIVQQILLSNLRLFITGLLVYYSLVTWQANPFALVAGLSLSVVILPILLLKDSGK